MSRCQFSMMQAQAPDKPGSATLQLKGAHWPTMLKKTYIPANPILVAIALHACRGSQR